MILSTSDATRALARALKEELLSHVMRRSDRVSAASAVAAGATTFRAAHREKVVGEGSNIVGIGYGLRQTAGQLLHDTALVVFVREKSSLAVVGNRAIPGIINGTPTDIVEVGSRGIVAAAGTIGGGVSCSHYNGTAGTVGCVVEIDGDPAAHILGCSHTFSDDNRASLFDHILHPARDDLPDTPHVATLAHFDRLDVTLGATNKTDSAYAKLNVPPWQVVNSIDGIGPLASPQAAVAPMKVGKKGRTTGLTHGEIFLTNADITVGYSIGVAAFEDQIAIRSLPGTGFARGGDSGALVVEWNVAEDDATTPKAPVGLLFAVDTAGAGGTIGYANHILEVLRRPAPAPSARISL